MFRQGPTTISRGVTGTTLNAAELPVLGCDGSLTSGTVLPAASSLQTPRQGWRSAQGAAVSSWAARRKSIASSSMGPPNCTPTGRPSALQ
jgi:hypothetical protein